MKEKDINYNVNVDVEIKNYKKVDILRSINIKKGNWFNATKVDNNIIKLTENIIDLFSFINIYPELCRREENIIDVNFIIKPGNKNTSTELLFQEIQEL